MEYQLIFAAALPSIISGFVLMKLGAKDRRDEKRDIIREKNRRKEGVLLLKNLDAIGALSEITAICYKNDKKPNGELDEAIAIRRQAKKDFKDHLYEEHEENKFL